MSTQKKTHDQQAREFWDFARHVSEEVEEWPTWKRNALVSFNTNISPSTSKEDQMERSMSKKQSHPGHRDSKSGQFVTEKFGKSHPKTTQKESIPNPGKGDTGRGKKK